jgi:cellulose synthase/poly-beta-1,6-N-acetylglucosamine synthase-like glycosyltransferase
MQKENSGAVTPLVSVCIPAYNNRDTILETIESVMAQTYKNLELILVDDRSRDDTWLVVCRWAKEHGTVVAEPTGTADTEEEPTGAADTEEEPALVYQVGSKQLLLYRNATNLVPGRLYEAALCG